MVVLNQVTPITITDLQAATTLSGNEATVVVQGGQSVQTPISSYPQGMTAGVVVYGITGGTPFPNYRTLKGGTGVGFADGGAQGDLTINVTGVPSTPPASASASGVAGTITWDSNFLYVAIGSNTWKRVALSTW